MAKLPTVKRVTEEEFPADVKKWLGKLLGPLNQFMEQVTGALNRNLTVNDNMSGEIKSITLDGTFPLKLSYSLKAQPAFVTVGYCRELSAQHVIPTDAIYVDWEYGADNTLILNGIVGVTPSASAKYVIKVLILTG